jgi:hypothetical protein
MMMKMTFTEDEIKQLVLNEAQRYVNCHTAGAWTAAKKNSYSADIDVFWDPNFVEHTEEVGV